MLTQRFRILTIASLLTLSLRPLSGFSVQVETKSQSQSKLTPSSDGLLSSASSLLLDTNAEPTKAYEQQPPHAGCHFRPTHPAKLKGPRKSKRFFEGWYNRITLPQQNNNTISFAFIFSIEDPFEGSKLSLCCHQIMGPNDEYLVQADPDHSKFWAYQGQQALGCVFEGQESTSTEQVYINPEVFDVNVKSGFQMLPNRLQGKLVGHDGSLGGVLPGQGVPGSCTYDITIATPLIAGWGDSEQGQKSTAGWLASYAVFEPHWQVTMADARATGSVTWKNETYSFENVPFYAEKNWGGAFPIKWYWCQCNSFDGFIDKENSLSVTAGGGTRKIPLGQTESLGMVSVHHKGVFYEATPWLGDMEWHISPWGYWNMTGRCTGAARPFEVILEAVCEAPGVKLRAPTEKEGMAYFCRDSFLAHVTLSLWELEWDANVNMYVRGKCVICDARSKQAAVEVGGGPWWDDWKASSRMKQPMKGMVRLPYRFANLRKRLFSKKKTG